MNQVQMGHVLDLLQSSNGTEPLKELFCSTLNYERVNRKIDEDAS
jgi:hypothetical protein